MGLIRGAHFKLSDAVSLNARFETQNEIDRYLKKLTESEGSDSGCDWHKDRFGLSWQIVPAQIERWMSDPDPARIARVMAAYMPMHKLDIETLENAYRG